MYMSIDSDAPSIASSRGATPSSGCTRSRILNFLSWESPLDRRLGAPAPQGEDRVGDLVGPLPRRKLHVIGEPVGAGGAHLEANLLPPEEALELLAALGDLLARDLE